MGVGLERKHRAIGKCQGLDKSKIDPSAVGFLLRKFEIGYYLGPSKATRGVDQSLSPFRKVEDITHRVYLNPFGHEEVVSTPLL